MKKMKKSIFALAITATLLAGTIISGCQSSGQKVDAAEENVAEARQDLRDAEKDADVAAQNKLDAEEWRIYRAESELTIRDNEVRINELKVKMKKPGKVFDPLYAKRIEALEQRNKTMKLRMETYEKNQSNWVSFRDEFKHDMNELGQAMKDLTVDNKK